MYMCRCEHEQRCRCEDVKMSRDVDVQMSREQMSRDISENVNVQR